MYYPKTKVFVCVLFSLVLQINLAQSGCRKKKLCCPGRNMTCVAVGDGTFPATLPKTSAARATLLSREIPGESFREGRPQKKTFLPTWHIHTGRFGPESPQVKSFADTLYSRPVLAPLKLSERSEMEKESTEEEGEENSITFLDLGSGDTAGIPENEKTATTSRTLMEENLLEVPAVTVGYNSTTVSFKDPTSALKYKLYFGKKFHAKPLKEQVVYEGKDPIIRYTVLNEHVPFVVDQEKVVGFLKMPNDVCYCDEVCVKLGDCCADYSSVCPTVHCEVSQWSGWGYCSESAAASTTDGDSQHCGEGVSKRERRMLRQPEHGGSPCPHLQEQRVCYSSCGGQDVALVLQYKFGEARIPGRRNTSSIYYDLPGTLDKFDPADNCTGEGKQNVSSFWSLVGNEKCHGMWLQKEIKYQCKCTEAFLTMPSYIFV